MRILILMIVALLVACGDGNGQEARQSDAGSAVAAAAADKPKESLAAGTAPCEMLTEAMIREYLQPGDIEITGEEGDTNQSVYCQYSWFFEPTEEERQQMANQHMEWIMAKAVARSKGEPVPPAPSFPNRNSNVFFNVMEPFESAQQASSSFDTMVQRLTDGIKVQTEELGEVEFKGGEMIIVEGLGDKAVWDPEDSQMSVLTGTQLFHLSVRLAGDVDTRADTERIAAELINRF